MQNANIFIFIFFFVYESILLALDMGQYMPSKIQFDFLEKRARVLMMIKKNLSGRII